MRKQRLFITIEGLEGSGKSSVIAYLKKTLRKRGYSVAFFREPGSTAIGEKIRSILLDNKNKKLSVHTELLLYLAARTQLIEEKLFAALQKYEIVICDRFFDSTLVYQGYALGLGRIARDAVGMFSLGVRPDVTFVLDVPARKGLQRLSARDRIESRPIRFHNRLRRGYLQLARREPARVKIIDARGSLEDIYSQVDTFLAKRLKQ